MHTDLSYNLIERIPVKHGSGWISFFWQCIQNKLILITPEDKFFHHNGRSFHFEHYVLLHPTHQDEYQITTFTEFSKTHNFLLEAQNNYQLSHDSINVIPSEHLLIRLYPIIESDTFRVDTQGQSNQYIVTIDNERLHLERLGNLKYDDVLHCSSSAFIVFYRQPGETLADTINTHKDLALLERLTICLSIMRKYVTLLEQGIFYRDFKPEHIILSDDYDVKFIDFKWALCREELGYACCSPEFCAPEVLNNNPHSFESNIYALACLFAFVLHIHPRCTQHEEGFKKERPNCNMGFFALNKPPTYNPTTIPIQVTNLLEWMLAHNRMRRPENREVIDELESCIQELTVRNSYQL